MPHKSGMGEEKDKEKHIIIERPEKSRKVLLFGCLGLIIIATIGPLVFKLVQRNGTT